MQLYSFDSVVRQWCLPILEDYKDIIVPLIQITSRNASYVRYDRKKLQNEESSDSSYNGAIIYKTYYDDEPCERHA